MLAAIPNKKEKEATTYLNNYSHEKILRQLLLAHVLTYIYIYSLAMRETPVKTPFHAANPLPIPLYSQHEWL